MEPAFAQRRPEPPAKPTPGKLMARPQFEDGRARLCLFKGEPLDFVVASIMQIGKIEEGSFQPSTQITIIARTDREGICLETRAIMALKESGSQIANRVYTKICRQVADTNLVGL